MEIIRGTIEPSELIISEVELASRLGMPSGVREAEVRAAICELYKVVNARFVATRVKILDIKPSLVEFLEFSVESSALAKYLSGCSEAYMLMATLGGEVDRLVMKKKARSLSEGYIIDGAASALAEAMVDAAERRLFPEGKLPPRFSPGYADCPLSTEKHFMNMLSADKYLGIKLLDSFLMAPMKSVSAFIKTD